MTRKQFLNIIVLIWLISLSGCSNDPNEKANELYVNAIQYTESMMTETESYTRAFEHYDNARRAVERILAKYTSSNIAVRLSSSETRVSRFTLSEFRGLESRLKQLSKAEQDPLTCALIVAKTIEDESSKALALADIAGKYAETGQLSQALETAKTIEDESSKAWALADIAGKYAEAGQKEEAARLLSQALETAKTIEYESSKAWALENIAGKYAETGLKPSQTDVAHLHDIVLKTHPMKELW